MSFSYSCNKKYDNGIAQSPFLPILFIIIAMYSLLYIAWIKFVQFSIINGGSNYQLLFLDFSQEGTLYFEQSTATESLSTFQLHNI